MQRKQSSIDNVILNNTSVLCLSFSYITAWVFLHSKDIIMMMKHVQCHSGPGEIPQEA